jgi:hypothetical protein
MPSETDETLVTLEWVKMSGSTKGLIVELQNTKQEHVADKYRTLEIKMTRNIISYLHCSNMPKHRTGYDDHTREFRASTVKRKNYEVVQRTIHQHVLHGVQYVKARK